MDISSGEYIVANAEGKPTSMPDYLIDRTIFENDISEIFWWGSKFSFSYRNFQFDLSFQYVRHHGPGTISLIVETRRRWVDTYFR